MLAIYKKELRSYFINPIGYVYAGIFLVFAALACSYTTWLSSSYDTSAYFQLLVFSFIILIPLLTMRLFSEEKKLRTEQLLLTAPVSVTGMVMGKYLAAMTVFGGTMLVSCINFIPLYVIGAIERSAQSYETVQVGPVTSELVGCFFAALLLGAALIALGMFVSSMTENQLSAAVITVAAIAFLVLVNLLNNATDGNGQQLISVYGVRAVLDWISVLNRYTHFANGYFDWASLLYYLSLGGVFVFLTVRVYERRRWN